VTDFVPWRDVEQLPKRVPIRRVRPDAFPMPEQVRLRLESAGIVPDSAGALLSAILRRGWTAWLVALPGRPPKFTAYILEPRLRAVWAMGRGATPAEALGAVYVLCVDEPPWERRPEDDALPGIETQGAT